MCSSQRSPQQVLYQLYNAITMTELKGYAMMQFSYMLLKTYGKGEIIQQQQEFMFSTLLNCHLLTQDNNIRPLAGNYTQESILMRKNFERRAAKSQELMQKVMEISDRDLWRCDPNTHGKFNIFFQLWKT